VDEDGVKTLSKAKKKPKAEKGLPVVGYKPTQSAHNIELVNKIKELEERFLRHLDLLVADGDPDPRCIAVARTGMQDAAMWAARAVFQPQRIALPEDAH
jgi:hypothetical protein